MPSVIPSSDPVFERFLSAQLEDGMAFSGQSDIVRISPLPPFPPHRYLVHFNVRSLAGDSPVTLREVDSITVGIQFFPHHLRDFAPATITVLEPPDLWHSNVRGPFVCAGHLTPGATLVDLLYQLYDIFRWANYSLHDALNHAASAWARQQSADRFPLDRRPLRRPLPQSVSSPES